MAALEVKTTHGDGQCSAATEGNKDWESSRRDPLDLGKTSLGEGQIPIRTEAREYQGGIKGGASN